MQPSPCILSFLPFALSTWISAHFSHNPQLYVVNHGLSSPFPPFPYASRSHVTAFLISCDAINHDIHKAIKLKQNLLPLIINKNLCDNYKTFRKVNVLVLVLETLKQRN